MRNKKEYKVPAALVTEFECAEDIMTESRTLYTRPQNQGSRDYVNAGSVNWGEGLNVN